MNELEKYTDEELKEFIAKRQIKTLIPKLEKQIELLEELMPKLREIAALTTYGGTNCFYSGCIDKEVERYIEELRAFLVAKRRQLNNEANN